MSASTTVAITKPTAVNKFVLGNFHKLINNQPISKDVCVKTDSKQNHPTCDPANFQGIIFHKDISEDMKRTLVFFHLHCKGCLVCAHINNTYGEKYTLLPHLCMPGRDDSYVPTSSSMYCPQLLRIDNPDKRRELVRKLTNL